MAGACYCASCRCLLLFCRMRQRLTKLLLLLLRYVSMAIYCHSSYCWITHCCHCCCRRC
jgi:hypothetical protein